MKYACEICGQQFDRETACIEHEKNCKKEHATGFEAITALNQIFAACAAAGVEITDNRGSVRVFLNHATYNPKSKAILLTKI